MLKYLETYNINGSELKISEETLLDNFIGVTPVNTLCSQFGDAQINWDYVKVTNAWGKGTIPTDRSDAEYIRVSIYDVDTLSIRINSKNDEHVSIKKINEYLPQ
jgi:hypothetical protein